MMRLIFAMSVLHLAVSVSFGQALGSQELSDDDGVPVIMKHLPAWDEVRADAQFARNAADLRAVIGDQKTVDLIDFAGGTEAASANYSAGRLLIVEYTNPKAASEADKTITDSLNSPERPNFIYRRIGNYAVFVLNPSDETSANALLDQVKYEKSVQWLDKDPYYLKKVESVFVSTTTTMLVGSVLVIVAGVLGSTVLGLILGFFCFRLRQRQRMAWSAYSDAGGLTRLNLDDLSEPILQK